jgi:hypothetical protein
MLGACLAWQAPGEVRAQNAASAISRASWTSIGPGNIGGRVRALAIHPTSTSTIFAGGANGGIWRSTDGGASWQAIDDFLPSLAVTTIVFQPNAPATMYAGTGESFSTLDGVRGAGILKSTDGGSTWSALAATNSSDFYFVNRLAMSADGSILLAATSAGLFRSTDGGGSFTQVLSISSASFGYTEVGDVKFLPGSSTSAIAAGNAANSYYSTNGGASWTLATGLPPQTTKSSAPMGVEIGTAPSAPSVVYLSAFVNAGEVWRSSNGGVSYTKVSTACTPPGNTSPAGCLAHLRSFGSTANAIWVSPTDANIVVVGGDDVYRSADGGASWTILSAKILSPQTSIHGQQHIIVSDPGFNGTTNRRVYFGNDGGVWKTDDIYAAPQSTGLPCCNTIPFTSLNNGLSITQFHGGAGDPTTGKIVGGAQGNGTVVYTPANGTQGWTILSGNQQEDAGYAAIDPTNPNYLYGSFPYLRLYRSTDGGASASYILGSNSNSICKPAPYRIDDACNGTANLTAPFMLDPNNSNRLLAGGLSLWRSDDVRAELTETTGPHWTAIKSPSGASPISAITVPLGSPDVIWVGHNNGDVYVTSNGTAPSPNWQKVDSPLPDRTVTGIAVDPMNTNVAYVVFSGFSADNVWKTTDNGGSWSALSGVPALPMRSISIDPHATGFLFLGTERGVFTSGDGGATWDSQSVGPANTAVEQLFWMGSTLVAVTDGRGMFTTSVASPVSANPASLTFTAARNAGGPALLSFTPAQSAVLRYSGAGTPAWTASADQPWISVSAGPSSDTFSIAVVNPGVIGASSSLSGTVTFIASNLGLSFSVPVALTVLTNGPSDPLMALDRPLNGATVRKKGFTIAGWMIDRGSAVGSGIDGAHIWAFPIDGTPGDPMFLGVATVNVPRPDLGPLLGEQFTTAGFDFTATTLPEGRFRLEVFAHSAVTGAFNNWAMADITVAAVVSDLLMNIDAPANGTTTGRSFVLSGWAADRGADTGTGVDQVHVWAFPWIGSTYGDPQFVGLATYGTSRPDLGPFLGSSQFIDAGFRLQVTTLNPGQYRLMVFARSTVTGQFSQMRFIDITVGTGGDPVTWVDQPVPGAVLGQPFVVSGWAIDRAALSGPGVDRVDVWAFPVAGGSPIWAGPATFGIARPDIGGGFGSQFTNSGYSVSVSGLAPGQYDLHIYSRSTVTNAFSDERVVRVTIN